MKLAHHNAFRTVDDELTAADHDRHVTEIDRLIKSRLTFMKAEKHVEGSAVSKAELATLIRVVARFPQFIMEIFKFERLVIAFDREDFTEYAFEACVAPLIDR